MMKFSSSFNSPPFQRRKPRASWAAFDAKFAGFRKDTTAVFRKALKEKLEKIDRGVAEYDRIEKISNKVTEWLNTHAAFAISASGDFYLPDMYDIKDFPKEAILSKIHWWLMRDEGMCKNVVAHSKAKVLKRVVVIAGTNHRKYMQDIFEKMPGVVVKT